MLVKAKIVFYANASPTIGAGHIVRLIALAQAFASQTNYDICFISKQCPDVLVSQIKELGFPVCFLTNTLQWAELAAFQPDVLVLDDYLLTTLEWQQINMLPTLKLVFDDNINDSPFCSDVVINPAPQATKSDYRQRTAAKVFCLGLDYTVLRSEFNRVQPLPFSSRSRLLLTLGGADVKQLALPLSQALVSAFTGSGVEITIVLGGLNTKVLPDLTTIAASNSNFKVLVNTRQMAQLMSETGLAIAAAGGTLGELASMAVPTLALVCVDNQQAALNSPLAGSWYQPIDLRKLTANNHSEINKLADTVFALWQNLPLRFRMSQYARQCVDTHGCERILQKVLPLLRARTY